MSFSLAGKREGDHEDCPSTSPGSRDNETARSVRAAFQSFVASDQFVCVGAKSALRRGTCVHEVYPDLIGAACTARLADDLLAFVRKQDCMDRSFSSFIASFTTPEIRDEQHFERLLWAMLQRLHDSDRLEHAWDPAVSADPDSTDFSFSFGGRGYFVVGLHPASSRWSRRFAWPTLVFNAHFQFERLRSAGKYGRMQQVIRERDRALQGSINPMLSDFGRSSEARQYAGRAVEAEWKCPFSPRLEADREPTE